MGIRIKKQIGYFIPLKDFKGIINSNYAQTLEDLDNEDSLEKEFFSNLFSLLDEARVNEPKQYMHTYNKDEYSKAFIDKKIHAYNLVSQVYFGDNSKGLLFCSLEQFNAQRYDDLIDYYDNDIKDNIKPLNKAIYPTSGYIYKGGLEKEFPNLKAYELCDTTEANIILKIVNIQADSSSPQKAAKQIVSSGYFHPNIESIIYMMAKAANIIEPHVTPLEFNLSLKPSIVSTWG